MRKIYTKNQMQISAFFLGPLGAIYFLKENFELLGKPEKAKDTFKYGLLGMLVFCLVSPVINVPGVVYLSINIAILSAIGMTFNREQIELVHKESYSNWKVFGVSLIGLLILIVTSFAINLIYILLGIIKI